VTLTIDHRVLDGFRQRYRSGRWVAEIGNWH
jgi:hypothetical protein